MGIDNNATKFLFAAAAAGASFRQSATLGRQNFYPAPSVLQELMRSRGENESAEQFLADSSGYAEKLFRLLGAEEVVAIDNSDYEGAAVIADMNAPVSSEQHDRFSLIFDGGCLEHVFNFPQAIRNCMEMLEVGGHFLGITPANNFCGHGFYQFSPELYFRVFSAENGFAIRAVLTKEKETWFRVMDPEEFGARVEIQNNRPTYLFVLAEKLAQREVFAQPPQQSDYARRWQQSGGEIESPFAVAQPVRDRIRRLIPHRLKENLRPLAATFSIRHRYPCYQVLDEERLLRGEFGSSLQP